MLSARSMIIQQQLRGEESGKEVKMTDFYTESRGLESQSGRGSEWELFLLDEARIDSYNNKGSVDSLTRSIEHL